MLDCPFHEDWEGHDGTISAIRQALILKPHQRQVSRRTLKEIVRCIKDGENFDGRIKSQNKLGRKIIIKKAL